MQWINKTIYPFKSNYISLGGDNIHYVDEGSGPVILFVHGTPEWSFGFRDLIKRLSANYRCVAIDHLGFGLSDKPVDSDYSVSSQAARLEKFIDLLELQNITIVANDFGGSIAMSYAINHPHNVNRIVLFNTWLWSLMDDEHYAKPAKVIHSWMGKLLYKRFNFPVTFIMPKAYGNRSKLTREAHRHYKAPLDKPAHRNGTYGFAKDILNAGTWWNSLSAQIDKVKNKPFLIFWGMKDTFILPRELDKWTKLVPTAKIIRYENAGHFVQEEETEKMAEEIENFLG